MRAFALALTFLTRISFPIRYKYKPELMARSVAYYPIVGAIMGLILLGFDYIFQRVFPAGIANTLLLISLVYLSGGLHLDGFMDTIDGIFSNRNKNRMLEIMHESTVGAFAVIAVVLLLLLKYQLLLELNNNWRAPLLILMITYSRWNLVYVIFRYPLTEGSSLAGQYQEYLGNKELITAIIFLLMIITTVTLQSGLSIGLSIFALLVNILFTSLLAAYIIKKIGGLTGDVYGAICELNELVFLMLIFMLFNF